MEGCTEIKVGGHSVGEPTGMASSPPRSPLRAPRVTPFQEAIPTTQVLCVSALLTFELCLPKTRKPPLLSRSLAIYIFPPRMCDIFSKTTGT